MHREGLVSGLPLVRNRILAGIECSECVIEMALETKLKLAFGKVANRVQGKRSNVAFQMAFMDVSWKKNLL